MSKLSQLDADFWQDEQPVASKKQQQAQSWTTVSSRRPQKVEYSSDDENSDEESKKKSEKKKKAQNKQKAAAAKAAEADVSSDDDDGTLEDDFDLGENQDPLDYLEKAESKLEAQKSMSSASRGKSGNGNAGAKAQLRAEQRQQAADEERFKRKAEAKEREIEKSRVTTINFKVPPTTAESKRRAAETDDKQVTAKSTAAAAVNQPARSAREIASQSITKETVKEAIAKAKRTYAGQAQLELKDVAGFFESRFSGLAAGSYSSDPTKPDEPLCFISTEAEDELRQWTEQLEIQHLLEVIFFLLRMLFSDHGDEKKPGAYLGLKIMFQVLVRTKGASEMFAKSFDLVLAGKWGQGGKPLQNLFWLLRQFDTDANVHPSSIIKSWSSFFVNALRNDKLAETDRDLIETYMEHQLSLYSNEQIRSQGAEATQPVSDETFFKLQKLFIENPESLATIYHRFTELSVFLTPQSAKKYLAPLMTQTSSGESSQQLKGESLRLLVVALSDERQEGTWQKLIKMFKHYPQGSVELLSFVAFSMQDTPALARQQHFCQGLHSLIAEYSNDQSVSQEIRNGISILEQMLARSSCRKGIISASGVAGLLLLLSVLVLTLLFSLLGLTYLCYPPHDEFILKKLELNQKIELLQQNEQFSSVCAAIPSPLANIFRDGKRFLQWRANKQQRQ